MDKKKARLSCISHLLRQVPYEESEHKTIILPNSERHKDYHRAPVPDEMIVPQADCSSAARRSEW